MNHQAKLRRPRWNGRRKTPGAVAARVHPEAGDPFENTNTHHPREHRIHPEENPQKNRMTDAADSTTNTPIIRMKRHQRGTRRIPKNKSHKTSHEAKENTPPKGSPEKTGQSARLSPLRSPKLTQEGKNMIGGGADASSPSRPPRRHLGSRSNSPSPEKLQSPRMAF